MIRRLNRDIQHVFRYGPVPVAWLVFGVLFVVNTISWLGITACERLLVFLQQDHWLNSVKYAVLRRMQPDLPYKDVVPFSLALSISAYLAYEAHGRIDGYCGAPFAEVEKFLGPPFDRNFIDRLSSEEQRDLRGEV